MFKNNRATMHLAFVILFVSCNLLSVEARNGTEIDGEDGGVDDVPVPIAHDPVIKFKSDGKSENATGNDPLEKSDAYYEQYDYVEDGDTVDNFIGEKSNEEKERVDEESKESDENFPNEVFLSLRNISGNRTGNSAFRGFTQKNDVEDLEASASEDVGVSVVKDNQTPEDSSSSSSSSTGNLRALRGVGQLSYGTSQDEIYPPFSRPPNTIDNADFSDCARQGEWKPIAVDGSPINLDDDIDHHHDHLHGHYQHQFGAGSELLQSVGGFPGANHWHDNHLSSSDHQLSFPLGIGNVTYGAPGFVFNGGGGLSEGINGDSAGINVNNVHYGPGSGTQLSAAEQYQKIKSSSMLSPPPLPPVIFGKKPAPWKSHKTRNKFNFDGKWKRPGGVPSNSGFNFGNVPNSIAHGGSFGGGGNSFSSSHIKTGVKGFGGGNFGGRPVRYYKRPGNGKYEGGSPYSGHLKQGSGSFGGSSGYRGNAFAFSGNFKHEGGNHRGRPTTNNHLVPEPFDGNSQANVIPAFGGPLKFPPIGGYDGNDISGGGGDGNGGGGVSVSISSFTDNLKQDEGKFGSGLKGASTFSEQHDGKTAEFNSVAGGFSENLSLDNGGLYAPGLSFTEQLTASSGESLIHGEPTSTPFAFYLQNNGNDGSVQHLSFGSGVSGYETLSQYIPFGGEGKIPSTYLSFGGGNGNGNFVGPTVSPGTNFAEPGTHSNGFEENGNGDGTSGFSNEIINGGYSSNSNYGNEGSATGNSPNTLSGSSEGSSGVKESFDETLNDNAALHTANVAHYEGEKENSLESSSHENNAQENVVGHLNGNEGGVPQTESVDFVHSSLVPPPSLENDGKESGGDNGHAGPLNFQGGYLVFGPPSVLSNPYAEINSEELTGANLQSASANLVATAVPVAYEKDPAFSGENILTATVASTGSHLDSETSDGGNSGGLILEGGLPQTPLLTSYSNLKGGDHGTLNQDSFLSTQILQGTREGNSLSDSYQSSSNTEYKGFDIQTQHGGASDDSSTFTCGKNHYQNTKYHTATFQVADTDHSSSVDIIKYDGDAAVIVQADRAPFYNDDYLKFKSFNFGGGIKADGFNGLKLTGKTDAADSLAANSQYNVLNRKPQTFNLEPDKTEDEPKTAGPHGVGPLSEVKGHTNVPRPQIFDGPLSGGVDASSANLLRGGYKKNPSKYPLRPGKVHFYQKNLKNLKPPFRYAFGPPQNNHDGKGERPISPRPIPLKYFSNSQPYLSTKSTGAPRPRIGGPKIVRVIRS